MGPTLEVSEEIHSTKYRMRGESFREAMNRIAATLKDDDGHYYKLRDVLLNQRFLPGGRIQAAIGSNRHVTAINCFVMPTIEDSLVGTHSIMDVATKAAQTMRMGGGVGYDFSTLRPRGDRIATLDSYSSGPISFMHIYDAVCGTISSAGHRRGAQMGILRVDHPDIEEFVHAKQNTNNLTNFNISLGITDEFMKAVKDGTSFDLRFNGRVYKTVDARALWEMIMRSTWDWAEPGVLFIDRMNEMNNLWYCEVIAATNPCSEQPLGPNAACLLGSFNLVKYVSLERGLFDFMLFMDDIKTVVRAMDNVIDHTHYPLWEQKVTHINNRRMGLGVTGLANAIEAFGYPYGSPAFLTLQKHIMEILRDTAYLTSTKLAHEKGIFPLFNRDKYLQGKFVQTLPDFVRDHINKYGMRNSHLLSIAPTGTISLTADNVSSGIEPVFSYETHRTIVGPTGAKVVKVPDYGFSVFGVKGKRTSDCTISDHLGVLLVANAYVDSAVSKTCNIGNNVTWDEFKKVYMLAYEGGAKGCTTFRAAGKRNGILNQGDDDGGAACYIDPATGNKTCE